MEAGRARVLASAAPWPASLEGGRPRRAGEPHIPSGEVSAFLAFARMTGSRPHGCVSEAASQPLPTPCLGTPTQAHPNTALHAPGMLTHL